MAQRNRLSPKSTNSASPGAQAVGLPDFWGWGYRNRRGFQLHSGVRVGGCCAAMAVATGSGPNFSWEFEFYLLLTLLLIVKIVIDRTQIWPKWSYKQL